MQPGQTRVPSVAARPRVLVVDDDSSMLQLVRSVLEADGYDVLTASDGEQALAVIELTPAIPVVVSDIEMPGMDGIRFLKSLGTTAPASCVPRVIFLTAHLRVEFTVAALRLGAVDFLSKPVRAQELLKAVASAVERAQCDRAALLPDQAATLAQQAEALAAALRGWTHSQAKQTGAASGSAGGAKPGCTKPGDFAMLGMDHLRRPRSLKALGELDDVGWELLLQLLRAEKSGQRLSVSALSISVEHVSPTTALRRIQELVKAGRIVRHPDPTDARRDFVTLAAESRAALEQYLEHVARELAAAVPSPR